MKKGFTLIELVMVIALIAIVASLAVMKFGTLRERSARTVSLANQNAIDRAVSTYLTAQPDGTINYRNCAFFLDRENKIYLEDI